jgi:membrane protein involved in colicin uptake
VLHQLPVPPSHINPQVTAELDLVILRSMAKTPEERYQTATEFMRALKQAATNVLATPVSADATMSSPAAHLVDQASLPDDATIRQRDIQFWRKISDSDQRADYTMYLQQFPHGEFADLARLRLAHIEKQEHQADQSQKRRRQELLDAATRERQQREAQVQAEATRRAQQEAAVRAKALAETQRQQEQVRKALLAQRVAQIKTSAEQERQATAAKQAQNAAEQVRRQQELAALSNERTKKIAEAMTKRGAESTAKEELVKESKLKLRRRIQRGGGPGK